MKLLAALLCGDDPPPGPKGLGQAVAQMGLMRGVLDRAWQAMLQRGGDQEGCQCLFVAPEFWFSNRFEETVNDPQHNGKYYHEDTKKWIVDAIAATSKAYPNVLIVPGTVLWCMQRRVGGVHVQKVKARYEALANYHQQTYGNVKSAMMKVGTKEGDLKYWGDDQLNAPGWTHTESKDNPKATPSELLDTGEYLIGANTAYIAKNGVVLKYHKIGNSAETSGSRKNIVFMPGNIVGQFNVGNVRYGLEICMDHWLGIQKNSNAPAPDVQIITSNTTSDRTFHMTGKSAIVHATNAGRISQSQGSSVYQSGQAKVTENIRLQTYADRLGLDLVTYDLPGTGVGARPSDILKPLAPQQDLSGTFGLRVDLPRIR